MLGNRPISIVDLPKHLTRVVSVHKVVVVLAFDRINGRTSIIHCLLVLVSEQHLQMWKRIAAQGVSEDTARSITDNRRSIVERRNSELKRRLVRSRVPNGMKHNGSAPIRLLRVGVKLGKVWNDRLPKLTKLGPDTLLHCSVACIELSDECFYLGFIHARA